MLGTLHSSGFLPCRPEEGRQARQVGGDVAGSNSDGISTQESKALWRKSQGRRGLCSQIYHLKLKALRSCDKLVAPPHFTPSTPRAMKRLRLVSDPIPALLLCGLAQQKATRHLLFIVPCD